MPRNSSHFTDDDIISNLHVLIRVKVNHWHTPDASIYALKTQIIRATTCT